MTIIASLEQYFEAELDDTTKEMLLEVGANAHFIAILKKVIGEYEDQMLVIDPLGDDGDAAKFQKVYMDLAAHRNVLVDVLAFVLAIRTWTDQKFGNTDQKGAPDVHL